MNIIKTVFAAAVLFVAGCSGTMQGSVRGTGERVQFAYQQGMDSDQLSAVVGSESFKGKAVMRNASVTQGTVYSPFGNNGMGSFANVTGTSTSGDFAAVLFGSRGSSLNCQLQYADPSGFTGSGGVGVCQHSDGRVIDVMW